MNQINVSLDRIADSLNAASAAYQIWFTLRGTGKALPDFLDDMNDYRYVDFFHASNSGHYKLMFIEIACLFDSNEGTDSIRNLKTMLESSGHESVATKISNELGKFSDLVSNMKTIRSRLIAHKESYVSPGDLYDKHKIKPDEIGQLIYETAKMINWTNKQINGEQSILIANETDRYEKATFNLLKVIKNGRS